MLAHVSRQIRERPELRRHLLEIFFLVLTAAGIGPQGGETLEVHH